MAKIHSIGFHPFLFSQTLFHMLYLRVSYVPCSELFFILFLIYRYQSKVYNFQCFFVREIYKIYLITLFINVNNFMVPINLKEVQFHFLLDGIQNNFC
jgi:hypothetical protein